MFTDQKINYEIINLLRSNFYDPDLLNDWMISGNDQLVANSLAKGDNNSLNTALCLLGSHTLRFTKEQIEYYHLLETYATAGIRKQINSIFSNGIIRYVGIGVLVLASSDRFFISSVVPDSPADKANLVVGDELVCVNDKPYEPTLSFKDRGGSTLVIGFRRDPNDKINFVSLIPEIIVPKNMLIYASQRSARIISYGFKTVGYYRPWSLAGEKYWQKMIDILTGYFSDVDALILDLRGNIGGASPEYAELFVGRSPELIYKSKIRSTKIVNRHWRKPLALIVDSSTKSGNEVFAYTLQRAAIPIVGTNTAGHVSAAMPFILTDNSLMLVAAYMIEVDGFVLEGKGVQPDLVVEHDIKYCAGRDPQLNSTLEFLLKGQ